MVPIMVGCLENDPVRPAPVGLDPAWRVQGPPISAIVRFAASLFLGFSYGGSPLAGLCAARASMIVGFGDRWWGDLLPRIPPSRYPRGTEGGKPSPPLGGSPRLRGLCG